MHARDIVRQIQEETGARTASEALAALNACVREEDLGEAEGASWPCRCGRWVVRYARGLSDALRELVLGHELAHWWFVFRARGRGPADLERACDEVAVAFLGDALKAPGGGARRRRARTTASACEACLRQCSEPRSAARRRPRSSRG